MSDSMHWSHCHARDRWRSFEWEHKVDGNNFFILERSSKGRIGNKYSEKRGEKASHFFSVHLEHTEAQVALTKHSF